MATRISEETAARIAQAWPDLIAAVAGTGRIDHACSAAGLSTDQVRVYRMARPDAEKEWQTAREQSADYYADQVAAIADNPGADSGTARVRMDAYRWLAAKRNPKAYNDKSTVDVNVRTVDLTRIIQDANARLAAAQAGRIIEGTVLRPGLEKLL